MPHDTRASWHDQPIPALTAQFRTDVQHGLTSSEAAQRLQHDGPNELRKGKTVSPLALLAAAVQQPGDLGTHRGGPRLRSAWGGG